MQTTSIHYYQAALIMQKAQTHLFDFSCPLINSSMDGKCRNLFIYGSILRQRNVDAFEVFLQTCKFELGIV